MAKDKLFYEGEEVVAINKVVIGIDGNANRASSLKYNHFYTIDMYWKYDVGHWWVSVKEISDAIYTEDEFASLISIKQVLKESLENTIPI